MYLEFSVAIVEPDCGLDSIREGAEVSPHLQTAEDRGQINLVNIPVDSFE